MEKAYKPCIWDLPDDYLSFERFYDVIRRLDRTSSPGFPYMLEAPTIGEWLGWDGVWYSEQQISRLWFDVSNVMDMNVEIVLRLFIKSEPHKMEKVKEGRWRLIMASPLSFQVVWHMLFSYMNDLEIEHSYSIPSQQGFVPVKGGWIQYLQLWQQRGYDTGLDKRAWDWNVPGWLLDLDLTFRYRMGRGSKMDEWMKLARWLYDEMFVHPKIVTSSGVMLRQKYPGIMKSGCVNTISTNSHMQIMVHIFACLDQGVGIYPLPVACGDDTLQRKDQAVDVDCYARYGAIVKSASEGLEFVGHEFLMTGPVPLYFSKHLEKAKYVSDLELPQYLDSMARMYCHAGVLFEFWSALARELGCSDAMMSQHAYCWWYDWVD